MLHQDSQRKRAGAPLDCVHPGVKDTVSQDAERRVNSSPLPKMERFYSLFQTYAAATYLRWLWLSQDPSVTTSREHTPSQKSCPLSFGLEKSTAVTKKEWVCPNSQSREQEREKDEWKSSHPLFQQQRATVLTPLPAEPHLWQPSISPLPHR